MPESFMRPIRFWNEYVTKSDGSIQTREMVELAHPNMQSMSTNVVWIRDSVKQAPGWETIAPNYEAWKKGQSAPDVGTPLGAWPGISQEQAEVFRAAGIRSVEDVAAMNDRVMGMVKLPNIMRLKIEAKSFLDASDQFIAQKRIDEQAEKIKALEDTIRDLADKSVIPAEPAQKRRGRPPRVEQIDVDLIDEDQEANAA